MKTSIKQLNLADIDALITRLGQKKFRSKQLVEWIYGKNVSSYQDISNLPAALIKELDESYPLAAPVIYDKQVSRDGTRKYLIQLFDKSLVETVAIPSANGKKRLTVCFSTQVGCPMKCAFCATGHEGFTRNLGMGEIIDQVKIVADDFHSRVTNLVGMGQGEPFLNIENTLDALALLNDKKFGNIGARHITVSTCGIPAGIDRFAQDAHQYTLAISLHSAIQTTRDELMPVAATHALPILKKHIENYVNATDRRVTFEYLLIRGINDDVEHLAALIDFCRGLLCHVNLLAMNTVESSSYQPSSRNNIYRWLNALNDAGIEASLRASRGSDINGACGQLKNSIKKRR